MERICKKLIEFQKATAIQRLSAFKTYNFVGTTIFMGFLNLQHNLNTEIGKNTEISPETGEHWKHWNLNTEYVRKANPQDNHCNIRTDITKPIFSSA